MNGPEADAMSEQERLPDEKWERLVGRLRSEDEAKRVHAALRLSGSRVDADRTRPAMQEALADENAHVRKLASWVLAQLDRAA
jgi:hypothetical protein